jgi:hypothetical protein
MGQIVIPGSQFVDEKAILFNGVDQYGWVDNPSFKGNTQGCFLGRYRPTTVLSAQGVKGVIGYGVKDAANNSLLAITKRYRTTIPGDPTYSSQPIPDIATRATNAAQVHTGYGAFIFPVGVWQSWGVQ